MTNDYLHPSEYDVLPRQWKVIKHRKQGEVVAAMLPYPTLDNGASCAGDPAWTADEDQLSTVNRAYMKSICAGCPLRQSCREYGIAHEMWGIWGGEGADDRKAIRRERRQILVEPHAAHEYGFTDVYLPMLVNTWQLNQTEVIHAPSEAD